MILALLYDPLMFSPDFDAEDAADLTLKMKKTNFIPLNVQISDKVISSLRLWIYSNVSHRSGVQIVDCARYLGAFLGPRSANVAWSSPIAKWSNRTSMISSSRGPISVSVQLYNSRALSTLSYVAQLSSFPKSVFPRERALLGRLLHLPGNAMASSDVFSLGR